MDYTAAKFWLDTFQLAATGLIGFYVWISNRHRITRSRIESLEAGIDSRISNLDSRITRVESGIGNMPSHSDIGKIYDRVDEVHGDLQQVIGGQQALRRTVELIQEHLLNQKVRS
jgi:hypothetical protein